MNLSMRWLSDYIKTDMPVKEFCHKMTMTGSKVEAYETEGSEISKVVAAKILSVVPHENSDHLVVCQVDIGEAEPVQIVTGASNVNAGDWVPAALNGSTLPGGIKIKKGKLRGVESNGMLCSLGELGLTVNDFPYAIEDGIFILQEECTAGQDIKEVLGFNDTTVEFEITSNRPDCFSVLGLAREAHATFGSPLDIKEPQYKGNDEDINNYLSVTVHNKELCPRYIGGIVKNVKIEPSPRWLRERLRASGVRPINNLVDITNFVMLEYGQPMHAFDLRYVKGNAINVRNAVNGEKIMTLDGIERELTDDMLVIADAEKPVAVAGVMGGEHSGIMDDTTTVVFESANFANDSVRKTAKKLGMRTDASSRYEKGINPENTLPAIKRAFELVEMLGAGEVVGTVIDCNNSTPKNKSADFDPQWINGLLGTDISEEEMVKCLESLGFRIENGKAVAPEYRTDIEFKADIAEEVARIYGYDKLQATAVKGVAKGELTEKQKYERLIKNTMTSLGCYEINTFSFISPKYFDKIMLPADSKLRNTITITNPLGEDTSVMRTTALPSLLDVVSRNYNNRNAKAMLFELGKEYIPSSDGNLPAENLVLSVGMYGDDVDFYTIKGSLEELLEKCGINDCEYERADSSKVFDEKCAFHPGRSAVIVKDGIEIGIFGELHPAVLSEYEIETRAYAAILGFNTMFENRVTEKSYKALPKFPATSRDLSLICDDSIPVGQLEKAIKNSVGSILEKITLFDVYKGKQIEEGKKSVSFSITMRSAEATLTDEQTDAAMKRVLKALSEQGAELRMA